MTDLERDDLAPRLRAWGLEEARLQRVRWTPEFLRLKARLARQERRAARIRRLEGAAWLGAGLAGLLGLLATWPHPGWTAAEAPFLLLPPACGLLLLGRSLWGLLEA